MILSPIVVVGAAGTGRETLDIIDALNRDENRFELIGVIDDFPTGVQIERLRARGVNYLGTMEEWLKIASASTSFVVAVAAPVLREKLARIMLSAGHCPATLIHPRAIIGSCVVVGPGAIVYGGVQISTNVSIGSYSVINANVAVGHDSKIGNFVSINPGATVSGEVAIGDNVLIGGRATVLQGLSIGPGAVVGAAALATKDVPRAVVVKGIPGKW